MPTPKRRPSEPRMSPSEVGRHLAQRGSLKGLPYGPGARQEDALKAFRSSTSGEVT